MAACKFVNVDPMNYVTLWSILHVYENSFGLLQYNLMWQEYEGNQWVLIQGKWGVQRSDLLRWTKKKMNGN